MIKYWTFALALYSLSITGWYQHDAEQHEIHVRTFERIIMQQEKLILEYELVEPVVCPAVEERDYTYDMWISEKPCPPGKTGPVCHMDETDYQ